MVSSPYMLTGWGELSSFGWGCLGPHTGLWEQCHPWREGNGREGSRAVERRVQLSGRGLLAWELV